VNFDEPQPQEAPVELDPRAQAVQGLALAEQRVTYARRERDRAVKRVEEVEAALAEARAVVSEALGVRENDLIGLR
jgi:hypothetical protein